MRQWKRSDLKERCCLSDDLPVRFRPPPPVGHPARESGIPGVYWGAPAPAVKRSSVKWLVGSPGKPAVPGHSFGLWIWWEGKEKRHCTIGGVWKLYTDTIAGSHLADTFSTTGIKDNAIHFLDIVYKHHCPLTLLNKILSVSLDDLGQLCLPCYPGV